MIPRAAFEKSRVKLASDCSTLKLFLRNDHPPLLPQKSRAQKASLSMCKLKSCRRSDFLDMYGLDIQVRLAMDLGLHKRVL